MTDNVGFRSFQTKPNLPDPVYACIESLNCSKSLYCTDVSLGMVSRGIINDSMEFETLPVGQGDVLVRGETPDGPGGTLFY